MENKLLRLLLLLAVAFLIATWTSEARRRHRKLFINANLHSIGNFKKIETRVKYRFDVKFCEGV